jgi:PAS domain S-box-containing protein
MTPADFQKFYGILPEPILLTSVHGSIIAANKAAGALIGRRAAELSGVGLPALTEESAEKVKMLLALFSRSAQFLPGSLAFRNGGFSAVKCRVEGAALREDQGACLLLRLQRSELAITRFRSLNERVNALHHEIMERKRAGEQLQAQRELLRITLASIGDGVIATNAQAVVTFVNPVAEALTGRNSEEAIGRPLDLVFRTVNEQTRLPVESPVAEVQRKGVIAELADYTLLIARNGSELPIADSGAPIYNAAGEMMGVVLVFRDVTARRKDERTLQEAIQSLQKSNDNLQQFAYAVAHDLKEPMRMVSLYSQLLGQNYGSLLTGHGQMFLQQTMGGARRMEELLEWLLAFMTAGELTNRGMEAVDGNDMVSKAVMNLQSSIEEAGAEVTWEALPTVTDHPASLTTLFQNLIGNGVKYRREGVTPRIHVIATRRPREWLIVVEDNGIGIEAEYHTRIFGVFKRLHPAKYPGTGIGLALCARVVESRGGSIWVVSSPGEGSRFFFTLPDR